MLLLHRDSEEKLSRDFKSGYKEPGFFCIYYVCMSGTVFLRYATTNMNYYSRL
jgi:hypothetical protein